MIPEASAGCVCQFSIASTVVMEPKTENHSWGIFSAVGPATPVKRMGINLGAPGDRKDASGQEWFGYPRPSTRGRLEYVFDLQETIAPGGGWYSRNVESQVIAGTDTPWLYTSGGRGLQKLVLPLVGKGEPAASYTVRLHFAVPGDESSGRLDVTLQGTPVANGIDIASDSGRDRAVIKEFADVSVNDNLTIELATPSEGPPSLISAVEVIRQQ